jgi:preprotein translocase subunit SecA
MLNLISKIFGNKHEKDVKEISPIVGQINEIYEKMHSLSDEQVKAKTDEFRKKIADATSELEGERNILRTKLREEALNANKILDINDKIKKLNDEIFEHTEEVLDEILPEAFATVKQACKRLKDDHFTFEYGGNRSAWEMIPYDVQLIGGVVIHQGRIAEMATGEGKTLVAVAPVYLNALAGKGVHVVTVNDYLAKRDSEWMAPVYEYLGLTVGAIQGKMDNDERRELYNRDIVYGTNNEFGFDYLRDNMVTDIDHLVQREHWFGIVDEVDSVLIDEARTPLIISGPVPQSEQKFDEMKPKVQRLVNAQNTLINGMVAKANELLATGNNDDRGKAGVHIFRAFRGLPKHKRLGKLLQDPELMKLKSETELFFLRDQGRKMHEIDDELFYTIDEKNHQIDITEKGRELLGQREEDPEMFVIPDITAEISMIEGDDELSAEEKQHLKDEKHMIYAERSDRIHTITQLLRAYSLYERDVEYVVQDGKIQIVDEFTGRILDGRRYSEGLHQAIEAKENVKVEKDTQTFATITLQNYFRLYRKLSGMTGTAETEEAEFEKIYDLDVVVIPTNKPIVRDDKEDVIYKTTREKYNAIINEIIEYQNAGRAILVGTASVEVSEVLSKMLKRKGVKHNVLNAKQHEKEAEVVAQAGKKGAVTIATNMAGRGTDIKLDKEVKQNGGLAIIGSERHDSRRIDRQLRGRAGRQGDPGSSVFFISTEDKLMRLFGGERMASVMSRLKIPDGEPIQHSMITKTVERAQKKVEENNFAIRKRLLDYDNVMNQQREVIYNRRKAALRGERLRGELFEFVEDMAIDWAEEYKPENRYEELMNEVRSNLLCEPEIKEEEFDAINKDEIVTKIIEAAKKFYDRKEEMTGSEFMAKLERVAVLQTIDDKWREHLRVMDDLKEGIHLRSYGQKDPLLEYKGEAYGLFVELVKDINKTAVQFAFKYFPQVVEERRTGKGRRPVRRIVSGDDGMPAVRSKTSAANMRFEKSGNVPSYASTGGAPQQSQPQGDATTVSKTFQRTEKKYGRNDVVEVRYGNGNVKKGKYKKFEKDIQSNLCEIID